MTTYKVKMTTGFRQKTLHEGLTENNARVLVDELRRLDKRGKFHYNAEPVNGSV